MGKGGHEMKHGEWRSDNFPLNEKVPGVSQLLLSLFIALRRKGNLNPYRTLLVFFMRLIAPSVITCAFHEANCSKCNKADVKYSGKHQY